MVKKRLLAFLIFFLLGASVFFLPIREHDYLRLRYFIGLWFFAEAAFLFAQGENRSTPLYTLILRHQLVRDRVVAGSALAVFFTILYLSVWYLMDHELFWGTKLAIALATILGAWLSYYGLCFLLGSEELQETVIPKFLRRRSRGIRK